MRGGETSGREEDCVGVVDKRCSLKAEQLAVVWGREMRYCGGLKNR